MSAPRLYQSLTLESNSQNIRILDLRPSRSSSNSASTPQPLEGTLRVVSLNTKSHFHTLSYVWGKESSDSPTIQIGEHHIRITTNCYEALSSLIQRYSAISIWVDSICIDQQNIEERSHQVALMGRIYRQAHTTFAWLGNGSDETSVAFSWLTEVAQNKKRWDVKFLDESKYLDDIFYSGWFSRGWTFQELILARNPVLFTRNDLLHWNTISRATECGIEPYLNYAISSPKRNTPTKMYELGSLSQTWQAATIIIYGHGFWLTFLINFGILIDIYLVLHRMDISWHEMFHEMPAWFLLLYVTVTVGRHILYTVACFLFSFIGYLVYLIIRYLTGLTTIPLWQLDMPVYRYITVAISVWRLTFIARFLSGGFELSLLIGARLLFYGNLLSWKTVAYMTIAAFRNQSKPCGGIIQTLRNRQVRDIKDTSYALYGVLQAFGANLAKPDYNKSPSQVFYQLAVNLLQWNRNSLIILLDAGQPAPTTGCTWIPLWKDSTHNSWIPSNILLQGSNANWWEQLNSHGLPIHTLRGGSLFVCAIFVDKVSHCIPFPEDFRDEHQFTQLHAMLEPLRTKRHFEYGVRMVSAGLSEQNRSRVEKELILWDGEAGTPHFVELLMKLAGCSEEIWSQLADHPIQKDEEFAQRLSACMTEDTGEARWFRYICSEIRGKCVLFVTQSGHVGIGPLWMQPQDEIHRISGLPRPLVLREQTNPGSFKVVGAAVTSDKPKGFFWLSKMKQIRLI